MISAGDGYASVSPSAPKSSGYPMLPPTTASSGFAQPSGMPLYNTTTTVGVSPTTGMPISPSSASASSPPEFTAGAAKVAGGAGALLAAAAAAAFVL